MSSRDYNEIFKKNFLTSVACEIRFTHLLIIKEKLGEFQKEIRTEFPNLEKGFLLVKEFEFSEWVFSSKDNESTLRIFTNRISIIKKSYNDFQPFYELVCDIIKKFVNTFHEIDVLTRIGLRYTNQISLNPDKPLEDILKWFNPLIYEDKIQELNPKGFSVELRIPKEKNIITCRNSLPMDKSPKYIIDIDSYTTREVKVKNAESIIKELHDLAIIEFHNSIKDEFLQTMRGEKELV